MSSQFPSHPVREEYNLNSERAFVDALGKKWQWNGTKVRWEPFQVYPSNETYDAESWDGNERAPTKNAVRDVIENSKPILLTSDVTTTIIADYVGQLAYLPGDTTRWWIAETLTDWREVYDKSNHLLLQSEPLNDIVSNGITFPRAIGIIGDAKSRIAANILRTNLIYAGLYNNKPKYTVSGTQGPVQIQIIHTGPNGYPNANVWSLEIPYVGRWISTSNAASPNLIPGGVWNAVSNQHAWKPDGNVIGTPIAVSQSTTASYIGQLAKLSGNPNRWWIAETLTGWREIFSISTDSPEFTGTPIAPTANIGTSTQQIATTKFVKNEIATKADLTLAPLTLTEQQQTNVRTNVNVRQLHSKEFTPTSTGWWRIATHTSVIGGVIRVTANDSTKTTDIEVSIHVDKDNRGVMNQTRHSVRGGGHISKFRVARNQNGLVICDVNVTAIPAPNTQLRLEADGILFPGFITPTLIDVAITDNETNQVDDLDLGNGLRSSGPIISHLGSSRDPGTSLGIAGRARYLHGLALTAGNARFTGASDHFHLTFNGASGANAGSRTAQGGSNWSTFQMQNSNSSTTNEIFLGGVNAFFYGDTEFGRETVNGVIIDYRYGISTDEVPITPLEPDFAGEVVLWYTSSAGFPVNGSTIMVDFQPGVAGISAAILPAIILSRTALVPAPDGRLKEDGSPLMVYGLRIKLYGLNPVEWNANYKTPFSPLLVWKTTSTPGQIGGSNRSLTPHPTRRDKVIAEFNEPHGMLLGQVVVLRLTDTSWGVSPNSYSGCITKIINPTTFEMKVGIVRQEAGFEIGARQYTTRSSTSSTTAVQLTIGSHPFVDGEAVKLSVMGTMQQGLNENTIYYARKTANSVVELYSKVTLVKKFPNNPENNEMTVTFNEADRIRFSNNTEYGIYTMYRANPSPALGADGWTIHKGNRDPVHQQTISDVGWNLHRNVFAGRRDIAAGVIGRVALGGLCDMPREVIGSAAVGFNSSSEADFTYTFGRNLRNTTTNSVEIGTTDSFKLRVTDNTFSVISDNAEVLSVDSDGDITIGSASGIVKQTFYTSSSDPTSSNIPIGTFGMWKNSQTNVLKLWANDGGTMKSIILT